MKKITPIAAIALFCVFATTSCKKKYTCECTYPAGSSMQNSNTESGKMKKSEAEAWCSTNSAAAQLFGGSCKLK